MSEEAFIEYLMSYGAIVFRGFRFAKESGYVFTVTDLMKNEVLMRATHPQMLYSSYQGLVDDGTR